MPNTQGRRRIEVGQFGENDPISILDKRISTNKEWFLQSQYGFFSARI